METCTCAAYRFPHRAGSGKCADPGPAPRWCSECPHGREVRDPYATGDYLYSVIECELEVTGCPWGKDGCAE